MTRLAPLLLFLLGLASPAAAQTFPPLTGRVVDTADLLPPADEAALTQKLEALERASSRQLVVATVPDLQGYPVEDYGYKLGRAWGIGQKGSNNGLILLIAKNEHKIRVEVGYGLEPVITDAFSSEVINDKITPAFKQGDFAGGIAAGVDALAGQLQAPPDQAEQRAVQAAERQKSHGRRSRGGNPFPLIFWGIIMLFVIVPMIRGRRYGRRYGGRGPVVIWGPGLGGGGGWGGGGGGGWGGFSGGGGGFSGGGGSFGGGGASGGW
ncbi:MAG TPA: TPM domain-containing protein [Allosphingosinicella sp.]|jgi:uncharacterized protein